ncbi:type II toxin-antitoxin system prevent-host-death family antitoxin [Pseudomonas sp. ArH3a]|uniref:type II toxin-antitoxin system Phd/YefM family antitoxin n=1 Tax=Pseudomonas TaxID=286 RepID=UPI000B9FADC7|nr:MULTISPECIES: type II toxin-antitoxin system prevent-host-death family antitoxin [unclassified Pseudomonas]MCV2225809.1 type II toxin-antitoxin system prevent-host-death family antitoxin [Pseudomonas sp. AU10]OZO01780.1 type II toxin-antitoxin system prevent-host-death family antitoxin [Pseudomonas sp. IB20]UNM17554.1 type II toxin-antitoxin system prevent-host-death family antitoxin [Pseudomonas sp. ArH3a]
MSASCTAITVSSGQAKASVSQLAHQSSTGQTILITKNGWALAQRVPAGKPHRRRIGLMRGKLLVPDDFSAPLPDDPLDAFEGAF